MNTVPTVINGGSPGVDHPSLELGLHPHEGELITGLAVVLTRME